MYSSMEQSNTRLIEIGDRQAKLCQTDTISGCIPGVELYLEFYK